MSEQLPEDRRTNGVEIPSPWGPIKVRGLGTILSISLVVMCLTAYMVWEGQASNKTDHSAIVKSVGSLEDAVAEQTYVLSLKQEDREKLNITMPETLRKKIRRNDR